MPSLTGPDLAAAGPGAIRTLIWNWGHAGASAKFTAELVRELVRHEELAILLSAAHGTELHALLATGSVPIRAIRTFLGDKASLRGRIAAAAALLRMPLIAWQFLRMLATHRVEVAVCSMQSIWDAAATVALSRRATRSVLVLHDAMFHPGDGYFLRSAILRWQVQRTDALVVLSDHVRQQAIMVFGYQPDRIWQMPHAALHFGAMPAQAARHPRGQRPLRLLFFGRIVAYKGLDHLLRAYRLLRDAGAACELIVAGSGSLTPYAALLRDLPGITLHNRWLTDEDIAGIMATADLAVLPYVEASQSGVAATAMAAGRPVVVTPVGGLPEQLEHGVTGLVVEDMRVGSLAASLRRFVDEPDLLDRCADAALDHATTALGWRGCATTVAGVVAQVARLPRRVARPAALGR